MRTSIALTLLLATILVISSGSMVQSIPVEDQNAFSEYVPSSNGVEVEIDETTTRPDRSFGTDSKDSIFHNPMSVVDRYEEKIGKEVVFSSEINELQRQAKLGYELGEKKFILFFDNLNEVPKNVLNAYNTEYLSDLPIAVVSASGNEITNLVNTPGLNAIYVNQYYQFISPDWIELDEKYQQQFEANTYPSRSQVGAPGLNDLGLYGTGINIAILDTGIDAKHPDLDDFDNNPSTNDPKVIKEKSFIDYNFDGVPDSGTQDGYGHGTHVAGIAAGNGTLTGIAPGANLFNGKVLDDFGGGDFLWIAAGVNWAVAEGADIISMSLGGLFGDVQRYLNSVVNAAAVAGVQVVTSAGNSGPMMGTIASPAMADYALAVGSSDFYANPSRFSSRGPSVLGDLGPDLLAPGSEIISTLPDGNYGVASGTSMAAPAVSGGLALLLSAFPALEPGEIRGVLMASASDRNYHPFAQGAGLMNLTAAYVALTAGSETIVHPGFDNSHPLKLSQGERIVMPFDIFVKNTIADVPQLQLNNLAGASVMGVTQVTGHWYQADVEFVMGPSDVSGSIEVTDSGSNIIGSTSVSLKVDTTQNDALSGSDAGETFSGALNLPMNSSLSGEITGSDPVDYYNFTVLAESSYLVTLGNLTGDFDVFVHDTNGSVVGVGFRGGLFAEEVYVSAFEAGEFSIRVFVYNGEGQYDLAVQKIDFVSGESGSGILTGNYSTTTVDEDTDGKIDYISFGIEVSVLESKTYDFLYSVAQNRESYAPGSYYITADWLTITLQEGLQIIYLNASTEGLPYSEYTGTYILDQLLIGDPMIGQIVDLVYGAAVTPSYAPSDFDVEVVTQFTVSYLEVDTNNDAEADELHMQILYTQTLTDYIWIDAVFGDVRGQRVYAWEGIDAEVTANTAETLTLVVPVDRLYGKANASLLGFVVSSMSQVIPRYQQYDQDYLAQFVSSQVSENSVTATPVDLNNNGLYDVLRFTFEMTTSSESYIDLYVSYAYSIVNESALPYSTYDFFYAETAGVHTYTLDYPINIFTSKGWGFPVLFPFVGGYTYEGEFGGSMIIDGYDISEFENPEVHFVQSYGPELVVTSGTAYYEVQLEFYSSASKTVEIMADVYSYHVESGYPVYAGVYNTRSLSTGFTNVSLQIEGPEVFAQRFIGTLEILMIQVRDVNMYDKIHDFVYHAGLIENISWIDIEPYSSVLITGTEYTPTFNGEGGLIDQVNFTLFFEIRNSGYFSIDLNFGNYYSGYYFYESFAVGNHSVSFIVDSNALGRALLSAWSPRVEFHVYDDFNGWRDRLVDSMPFSLEELDYELPLSLISVEGELVDTDNDGLFEKLSINLQVNVSVIDYYWIEGGLDVTILLLNGDIFQMGDGFYTEFQPTSTGVKTVSMEYNFMQLRYILDFLEDYEGITRDDIDTISFGLGSIQVWDSFGVFPLTEEFIDIITIEDASLIDVSLPIEFLEMTYYFSDVTNDQIADTVTIVLDLLVSQEVNIDLYFNMYVESPETGYLFDMWGDFNLFLEEGEQSVNLVLTLPTDMPDIEDLPEEMIGYFFIDVYDQNSGEYFFLHQGEIIILSSDLLISITPSTTTITSTSESEITEISSDPSFLSFSGSFIIMLSFATVAIFYRRKR